MISRSEERATSVDVLGKNAGFGARRKDRGFWIRKGGSMHNAWISETLRAEVVANRKSTLSVKFRVVA